MQLFHLVRGSKQTLHLHCFHIYLDISKHVGATGMAVSSCNEVWQPPGCHLLPIIQFDKRETWEWRWECDAINHLLQVSIKVGKLQNHPLCLPTTRQQDCRAAHLFKETSDFLRLPTPTVCVYVGHMGDVKQLTCIEQWWSHSCSKPKTSILPLLWPLSALGRRLSLSMGMSSAVDGEIAPPTNKTPLEHERNGETPILIPHRVDEWWGWSMDMWFTF